MKHPESDMIIKKTLLAAMFAASIGAAATSANAIIYVRVAPPEQRDRKSVV